MKKGILLLVIILIISCKKETTFEKNFDTPQGAVLCLEDAFRSGDVDKILECKDFELEAVYMLRYGLKSAPDSVKNDEEILNKLSEALELGFIKEVKETMPNFDDIVKSEFPKMEKIDEDFVLLEEVSTYSDGGQSRANLIVGKKGSEWRMVAVEDLFN